MGSPNAPDAFLTELDRIIEYFRDEWEITYVEAIGCLEVTRAKLVREVLEEDEDDAD